MTFHELWTTWKGITTVATSIVAVTTMVYGASVWVNDFVFSESQAGEMLEQQHQKQLYESYSREQGDLEMQLEMAHFKLDYFRMEEEYRPLNDREKRVVELTEQEAISLENRIEKIQCFQDPMRDPLTC